MLNTMNICNLGQLCVVAVIYYTVTVTTCFKKKKMLYSYNYVASYIPNISFRSPKKIDNLSYFEYST